jgi:hypothetical protein
VYVEECRKEPQFIDAFRHDAFVSDSRKSGVRSRLESWFSPQFQNMPLWRVVGVNSAFTPLLRRARHGRPYMRYEFCHRKCIQHLLSAAFRSHGNTPPKALYYASTLIHSGVSTLARTSSSALSMVMPSNSCLIARGSLPHCKLLSVCAVANMRRCG